MPSDIYFRTSLTGYNKSDVIAFIEKLNAEQIERVNELNERLRSYQTENKRLAAELDECKKKCDELREKLSSESKQSTENQEKAQKYESMQGTYADIMLAAEISSKEKLDAAEKKAEAILEEAMAIKNVVVTENRAIIENAKVEFLALVEKLTDSLDDTLAKIDSGASENKDE